DAERSARDVVRSHASTLTRPAPTALRARCLGAVPSSASLARNNWGGLRVRRWVPLSIAATVLLAVVGVFMAGQQERLEASFAAQLAIDHEKCFHEFGTGHPRLDAAEAEARLATEHGFDVSVPAGGDVEQIELVDVRSCAYDGGHIAHLLYEVEGQSVSLYVLPDERLAERSLEVVGHQTQLWSDDEAAYVLVCAGATDMDKVAAYMRGYEGGQ
ncbi:MAG: hypothetical protein QF681_17675, partial [Vicinamibacterales bacterium]|nr:hypothetical protein [Vicinamibacterales bacterium]